MANTLRGFLILIQLVTLVLSITSTDKKEDLKVKEDDAKNTQDDLEPQETGWIFNPLQEKARELEYLKNKIFVYPFSALKSSGASFGSGYPIYSSGGSNTYSPGYAGGYPSYSFSGSSSYYPSPKPKQYQYYNPIYTSYKKSYPSYPTKSWYNKNYYSSGGYQFNTATYAPDCHYTSSGPTFQVSTTPAPTYSTGTPIQYYYSDVSPSQTYGVPGVNIGAKTTISVPSTPAPISYSSYHWPSFSTQAPPSSYRWRVSSSPQYSDSVSTPGLPSFPSLSSTPVPPSPPISSSTFGPPTIPAIPSAPTTPSPPFSSTIPTSSLPNPPQFSNPVPAGPSSFPVPIVYSNNDKGPSQEVIITPPPPKGHYVTTLPETKVALPDAYYYNQPPSYAVAYYPNVFYITNEQRLEKTSSTQSVAGAHGVSGDGASEDFSTASTPSSDSQSTTTEDSTSSAKSHSVQTLPGPGLSTFYSSQTLDQTRIPVSYIAGQSVVPQTPGVFYSSPIDQNVYAVSSTGGASGSYVLPQNIPAVPLTNTISSVGYPQSSGYSYGQSPIVYQLTRTSKQC